MRRIVWLALVSIAVWTAWPYRHEIASVRDVVARYLGTPGLAGAPHERYAATIRARDLDATIVGRAWLDAASAALEAAEEYRAPFSDRGTFDELKQGAAAWRFPARRGQRVNVEVEFGGGELFLDLFQIDGKNDTPQRVASAAAGTTTLEFEVERDGELMLRAQPELLRSGVFRLRQRSEASLLFPVQGATPRAVQSTFGDPRDSGRRKHEGIDIFAARGTPVVAAVDGFVSRSTENRLGGKVVWLWSPTRGIALYYAHLDRHAVSPGARVTAGEVLGYVGNTGNARGTAPHLHFGIYASRGGAVDPLPFVCDAPCGERLMHRQRRIARN